MTPSPVIHHEDEITPSWLSQILAQRVEHVRISSGSANWSRQLTLEAQLADGTKRALRLKVCTGETFGRSEVDYYTRDYVDLPDAPLVPCFDAQYDPAVGYHILLADLAATHSDRRDAEPSLAYGLAVAEALASMHRHYWESRPAPDVAALDRYFDEIRPGLVPLEKATGCALQERFERHEKAFRQRWAQPQGMTLLHGDLNPTNVLTPKGAEAPVYFLDRQPFNWSLTYGLAVSDLAYFMIPWWPEPARQAWEQPILRRWHEALDKPGYRWSEAQADWRLSVEQCLNVPMQWCSRPATMERMRWLWELQFARVQDALRMQTRLTL